MTRPWRICVALVILGSVLPGEPAWSGSSPELIRVRVPEGRVATYFPTGTAVRTLPIDRFEALVAAAEARTGSEIRRSTDSPRPVRIEHFARWEGSSLLGRSVITPPTIEPGFVACEPWSPALITGENRSSVVRADPKGLLEVGPTPDDPTRPIEIPWRQMSLPDSQGRTFSLLLPAANVARLVLDLPADLIPNSSAAAPGSRVGPTPGSTPDRRRWEFLGASGTFPLQLVPTGDPATMPRRWLGGPTRIDLNVTRANWQADWRVEATAGAPETCLIELDPGIELIDVAGPDVADYQRQSASDEFPGRSRVGVRFHNLDPRPASTTTLTIRGQVQAPPDGSWLVPSARPVDAGWLGGRTEVRLDPSRVAAAVLDRAGIRVAPQPEEITPPGLLLFESTARPGPVAEIRIIPPTPDASVTIRGTLHLGASAPRIEILAQWTVDRGRLLDPTLDFPEGWVVDRVTDASGRSPVAWHSEPGPEGASRVRFDGAPETGDPPALSIAVRIAARWDGHSGEPSVGPFPLPRVRPTTGSVRVAAEDWLALVDRGWSVEPIAMRGLVWVDPPAPDRLKPRAPATSPTLGEEEAATEIGADPPAEASAALPSSGQRLAWRWVSRDAAATVERHRHDARPRVEERLEAAIIGDRLRLVWHWTIADANRPASLPLSLPLDPRAMPRWRVVDRLGTGFVVDPETIDSSSRSALGVASTGTAVRLPIGSFAPGPLSLRGETEIAWEGSGSIPISRLLGDIGVRRSVVVRVEDSTRFRIIRAEGLTQVGRSRDSDELGVTAINPDLTPIQQIQGENEQGLRVAAAWLGEGDRPADLQVATLAAPDPADGILGAVITEASLSSRLSPDSDSRHRLILRVTPGLARTFHLTLPERSTLDRILRDGQPALATTDGSALRINVPLANPGRSTATVTLDYRTEQDFAGTGRIFPARLLPTTDLPCLSFAWQIKAPERFAVASESPSLVNTDLISLDATTASPFGSLGGGLAPDNDQPVMALMLRDLDQAVRDRPPLETTLGDWLVQLDAGRWPLVLDRLALQGEGWGPRSRINATALDATQATTALGVFRSLGLTVEPLGAVFLVSTEADQRIDRRRAGLSSDGRAKLGQTLFDVAMDGSDRSDRYQSPARWRGEPTPRAWLANETPDRGLVAIGWRSHRFTAATWPVPSTTVRLLDRRISWRRSGLVAVALVVVAISLCVTRLARVRGRRRVALVLGGFLAVGWSALGQNNPVEPILAILPYRDLANLDSPPDRVILRQEDHDRLVQRASRPPAPPRVYLRALTHHVAEPVGRSVAVESQYDLEVVGEGGGTWPIPVGPGFDLAATVAGRTVPLKFGPDGRIATVEALPNGRSSLVYRRSIPLTNEPSGQPGDSITFPVNPAPFARLEVARGDESAAIALDDLVGSLEAGPNSVAGELGPRDQVTVRWGASRPTAPPRVEFRATTRWDATASGDRVIIRLTLASQEPIRTLRLGLEPGVAVESWTIPGLVGSELVGTPNQPEWLARIDPPLKAGTPLEITCWRPGSTTGSIRKMPRWRVVGGSALGWVGIRRPQGWTGRLVSVTLGDALGNPEFVRRWGALPGDGLSLAGGVWFDGSRPVVAEIAPDSIRPTVHTEVALALEPEGLKASVDSVWTDRGGTAWAAEASFGSTIQLTRVQATGLVTWNQPQPDRVRLVFDGSSPARTRSIHLEGRLEVESPGPVDQTNDALVRVSSRIPWPKWLGADSEAGQLTLAGPEDFQLKSGVEIMAADPATATDSDPPGLARRTFSRAGIDSRSRVEWTPPPARVNVIVASDLRLEPDQMTWTAAVTSEVSGGVVRALHWRVPTVWLENATLTSDDGTLPRVNAEIRGDSTFWTIHLDRPLWSRRTLTIRSSRPRRPGEPVDYPEVAPLSRPGRGQTGQIDLAVTNLTGRPIDLSTRSGLVAIPSAEARLDPSAVPEGVVSRAFRVQAEPWSLRLRPVPTGSAVESNPQLRAGVFDDLQRAARVRGIEIELAVDALGAQGQAAVRIEPGSAFMVVKLPDQARLVGASVEGRRTMPIASTSEQGSTRWLIPLGDLNPGRVDLIWQQPSLSRASRDPDALVAWLPQCGDQAVPTSIRVSSTAPGATLEIEGGRWTRLDPAAAALARFERWGSEIDEATRIKGQPSPAVSSAIVARLVAMDLELRAQARARQVADPEQRVPIKVYREIQRRAVNALQAMGAASLIAEARQKTGLGSLTTDPEKYVSSDDSADSFRIRQVGSMEQFRGTSYGSAEQSRLIIRLRQP